MPKKVTKYQCNYCKKCWVAKSRANKHENRCFKNPEVKSCATCNHLGWNEDYDFWCERQSKRVMVKGHPIFGCIYHNIFDIDDAEEAGDCE
jgi:hypothetical protein